MAGIIPRDGLQPGDEQIQKVADDYVERGLDLAEQGEYILAILNYSKAIKLKPDYARAYYDRGVAFGNKGNYIQAMANYDQAIKLKPDYSNAYVNRGVIYSRRKQYDLARADYYKAIEINPNDADVYNNLGILCDETGETSRALANYDKAIELKQINPMFYYNRGQAYYLIGDYDRAIADYSKAIVLNPLYVNEYYWRGQSYYRRGDYDLAVNDFAKAIELEPESDYPVALLLCYACLKSGKIVKTLKCCIKYIPVLYFVLSVTIILALNLLLALIIRNPFHGNSHFSLYILIISPFFITGAIIVSTILTAFPLFYWMVIFRYGLLAIHIPLMYVILKRMKKHLWFATSLNIFAIWTSLMMPWVFTLFMTIFILSR